MKLPLKFRILQLIASERKITNVEIAIRISGEYPGERQTRKAIVEDHITAFQTTGIITSKPTARTSDGTLIQELTLTSYGVGRLGFLPRRFRAAEEHRATGRLSR